MAKKMILAVITVVYFVAVTTNIFADDRRDNSNRQQYQNRQNPQSQQHQPQKPQSQQYNKHQPQRHQNQNYNQARPVQHHVQRHYPRPMYVPVRYVRPIYQIEPRTIIIWITNNNGSQTQVLLTAVSYGGYLGPRGEYYAAMPTYDHLKAMYGIPCVVPERTNVVVYLGNVRGNESVVILTRKGTDYYGPRGECYHYLPTVAQLSLTYGR